MRLIDADALIHELNNSHYPGTPYIDAGISIAIGKVLDAPTIRPEQRWTGMIYCYCEGCKNHDDDDTCKLHSVTISDREMTAAGFLPLCQEYEEEIEAEGSE